jgi:hypothetical protein
LAEQFQSDRASHLADDLRAGFSTDASDPENAANRAFTDEMIQLTLGTNLDAAAERFRKRSKGVDLLEDVINAKGYELINGKKLKESIDIFKLNVIAFPNLRTLMTVSAKRISNRATRSWRLRIIRRAWSSILITETLVRS